MERERDQLENVPLKFKADVLELSEIYAQLQMLEDETKKISYEETSEKELQKKEKEKEELLKRKEEKEEKLGGKSSPLVKIAKEIANVSLAAKASEKVLDEISPETKKERKGIVSNESMEDSLSVFLKQEMYRSQDRQMSARTEQAKAFVRKKD